MTPARDVVVATTSYDAVNPLPELLAEALERDGFDVWRMPLSALRRAARRERRPIVVLLHWIGHVGRGSLGHSLVATAKYALLLGALRIRGVHVVWYRHNDRSHDVDHPRVERVAQWLTSTLLADRTIAMSQDSAAAVRGRRARARTRVVPHPSYEQRYPPPLERDTARTTLGLNVDGPLFLSFGHVREYKRVPELIEAFSRSASADATLLVAGNSTEPWLTERLTRLAAADERVHLRLEVIPHDDVATIMGAADWVVLAHEGVLNSGVALLALTFAVPVIAPASGSLPEVLGDADGTAGILYQAVPDGLDRALARAGGVDADERASMAAASERARGRTALDIVAGRLGAVIEEAAARR